MRFLKALFGRGSSRGAGPATRPSDPKDLEPIRRASPPAPGLATPKARDVVGESNYQDALKRIAGGYRRESQALVTTAIIALDPENRFDPNAVRVEIDGETVGYLPAAEAKRVGGFMRDQGVEVATVEAQVRGGWRTNQYDKGHFGVRLKIPRSGWIDFGVGAKNPKKERGAALPSRRRNPAPEPAAAGPLVGQWIVLWGFSSNGDVAREITAAGGKIMTGVGKSTTMIVRDDDPITSGMRSSATWRKLEELRTKGKNIEMITWRELKARITKGEGRS